MLYYQVASFRSRGLKVASISSVEEDPEGVEEGKFSLVHFTPEMLLQSRKWREMLRNDVYTLKLRALVIDEAHTVKKWYVR